MSSNRLYTKGIVLNEITEEQFNLYKPFWNVEEWNNRNAILCEITHTIVYTNYKHLLFFLLKHPYADELSVRFNEKVWDKEYIKEVMYPNGRMITKVGRLRVEDMVDEAICAACNTRGDNYLEIYFKERGIKKDSPRALIEFSDRKGLIIATQVVVPPKLAHLFTI